MIIIITIHDEHEEWTVPMRANCISQRLCEPIHLEARDTRNLGGYPRPLRGVHLYNRRREWCEGNWRSAESAWLGNENRKCKDKGWPDNKKFCFREYANVAEKNGQPKSQIHGRGLLNGFTPPPLHMTRRLSHCLYPELSSISSHLLPALPFPLTRPISHAFFHARQP